MAVLDWEFSGAYPLSELIGGAGVDVLEIIDEESEKEIPSGMKRFWEW